MNLGELSKWVKQMQMSWTDDTDIYVNIDAPYMYAIVDAYEDDEQDCLVIATHPFSGGTSE